MKRPSYKKAIEWIALNDEPAEMDSGVMSEMISCALVADLFGMNEGKVGHDVVMLRRKEKGFEN